MSVTFQPVGNYEYCKEHNLLVFCPDPDGETMYDFWEAPFELNVSNSSSHIIIEALGLEKDPYGDSIHPQALLNALTKRAPNLLLVRETVESSGQGPTMVECGYGEDRLNRYWEGLQNLAIEAIRREVNVHWG